MAFKDLASFISFLESKGELVRIKEYVNPELEIAEITEEVQKLTEEFEKSTNK